MRSRSFSAATALVAREEAVERRRPPRATPTRRQQESGGRSRASASSRRASMPSTREEETIPARRRSSRTGASTRGFASQPVIKTALVDHRRLRRDIVCPDCKRRARSAGNFFHRRIDPRWHELAVRGTPGGSPTPQSAELSTGARAYFFTIDHPLELSSCGAHERPRPLLDTSSTVVVVVDHEPRHRRPVLRDLIERRIRSSSPVRRMDHPDHVVRPDSTRRRRPLLRLDRRSRSGRDDAAAKRMRTSWRPPRRSLVERFPCSPIAQ
jgi:hypothetical protein